MDADIHQGKRYKAQRKKGKIKEMATVDTKATGAICSQETEGNWKIKGDPFLRT